MKKPRIGDRLELTDGTKVYVQRVGGGYPDRKYLCLKRVDNERFTIEQAGFKYEVACWSFDGSKCDGFGTHEPDVGLHWQWPKDARKEQLEAEVEALSGRIEWTDPDLFLARKLWAENFTAESDLKRIRSGESDHGQVIQTILKAIRITKENYND